MPAADEQKGAPFAPLQCSARSHNIRPQRISAAAAAAATARQQRERRRTAIAVTKAQSIPPVAPSTVFFGLMAMSCVFPNDLPTT